MTETLTPDMIAYLATSLAEMIAVMAIMIGMALIACGLIGKRKSKPLFYHDYFEPTDERTEEMKLITREQIEQLNDISLAADAIHEKIGILEHELDCLSRRCVLIVGCDVNCESSEALIARSIVEKRIDVDTAVSQIIGEWANQEFDKALVVEVGYCE